MQKCVSYGYRQCSSALWVQTLHKAYCTYTLTEGRISPQLHSHPSPVRVLVIPVGSRHIVRKEIPFPKSTDELICEIFFYWYVCKSSLVKSWEYCIYCTVYILNKTPVCQMQSYPYLNQYFFYLCVCMILWISDCIKIIRIVDFFFFFSKKVLQIILVSSLGEDF